MMMMTTIEGGGGSLPACVCWRESEEAAFQVLAAVSSSGPRQSPHRITRRRGRPSSRKGARCGRDCHRAHTCTRSQRALVPARAARRALGGRLTRAPLDPELEAVLKPGNQGRKRGAAMSIDIAIDRARGSFAKQLQRCKRRAGTLRKRAREIEGVEASNTVVWLVHAAAAHAFGHSS